MNKLFLLGLGTAQIWLLPYPNTKLQLVVILCLLSVSYAFVCCKLPIERTKPANNTNKKQQLFFPHKEEKEKKEEKKDMQVQKQWSGGCQGFLNKKYYPKRSAGVEIFFKNPQGLTFTAGKRNG